MKRYVGKQLLACLLALAMFTTNVDAVCAAEAGAVSENGGVRGIASSEAAPGAGSGAVVRTMADGSTVIEPAAETATREGIAGTSAASAVEDPSPAVQKTAAPADETPGEETPAPADEVPGEGDAPADETTGEEITDPEEETGEADPAENDGTVAEPGADDPADLIDPAEEDSIADPDDPETLTLTLEEEEPELLGRTIASGKEGNLDWELSDEGILTFTANPNGDQNNNAIANYSTSNRPTWENYKADIKEIHFRQATYKQIGEYAFYQYDALQKVTFDEGCSLTDIRAYAFYGCTALAEIGTKYEEGGFKNGELPRWITSIKGLAFSQCPITTITIPKSCADIYATAFQECTELRWIEIMDGGNDSFFSRNGIIYQRIAYGGVNYQQYIKPEGYAVIKVSVGDQSREFTSFAEAVSEEGLTSVANGIEGEYTFWLREDVTLAADVILPRFVSAAYYRSTGEYEEYDSEAGENVMYYPQLQIDLAGFTLSGRNQYFESTVIPYSSVPGSLIQATEAANGYATFAPVRYDRQAAGYTPGKFVRPDGTVAAVMPQADGTGCVVDHPECWTILLRNTDVTASGGIYVNCDPICLEGFDRFSYDFSGNCFTAPTLNFWNGNYKLPAVESCRVLNIGLHAYAGTTGDINVTHQLIIGNGSKFLVNDGDTVMVKKGDNKDTGALIFTEEGSLFLNAGATVDTQNLATYPWRAVNPDGPTTMTASTGRIYQQDGALLKVTDNVTVGKVNATDPPLPIEFYPLTEGVELADLADAETISDKCGDFGQGTKLFNMPADKAEKAIDAGFLAVINADPASKCTMIYPGKDAGEEGVYVGRTVYSIAVDGAEIGYPTITRLFTALAAINDKEAKVTVTLKAAPGECELKFPKAAKQLSIVGAGGEDGTDAVTLKPANAALNFPGDTVLTNLALEPAKATALTAASSLTLDDVRVKWPGTDTAAKKVTVKAGTLTVAGDVFFNTPMVFDGGNKAGFTLEEGARLIAAKDAGDFAPTDGELAADPGLTVSPSLLSGFLAGKLEDGNGNTKALYLPENGFALYDDDTASGMIMGYVEGGFQNFAAVTLYGDRDDSLETAESFVVAGETGDKSPVWNNPGSVVLKESTLYLMDRAAKKGTVKLADLMVDGARFITEGSLNLTTLRLGNGSEVAALEAYNITGTLFNRTQGETATLTTAQRFTGAGLAAKGGAQLNITAAVNRVDADARPITVRVLEKDAQTEAYHTADLICGDDKSDAYRRLLAVTNAAADDFTPDAGCVGGEEELDAEKLLSPDGSDPQGPYSTDDKWLLSRENKDFVVRSGADLTLLLLKQGPGGYYDQQIIGAYRTFKDVNAVIDARKDVEAFKDNQYTILLMKDYNCSKDDQGNYIYTPGPVDFPYYTNHLEIRGMGDADPETDGVQPHVLCFSGNLFVRQRVTFTDVRLEPYSKPGVENHTAQLQLRPRQGDWSFETVLHHVTGRIGAITGTMEAEVCIEDCGTLVIENGISCGEVHADSDLTIADGSLTTGKLSVEGDKKINVLTGSVTAKSTSGEKGLPGSIFLPGGAQLLIPNGSLTAETLDLKTNSLIRVDKGTVTVNGAIVADDDVDVNEGQRVARIAFPAPGKSKPNFTVKGGIGLRSRDLPLELQLLPTGEQALTPGDLTLRLDPNKANKVLTTAAYQIADIGTNPSGSVKLFLENAGSGYGIDSTDYLPVKTGKLLYLADVRESDGTEDEINARSVIRPALTKLPRTSTDACDSCYLDYNSAVKEINTLADRTETYEITPGFLIAADAADRAVKDLDLTDANKHSALTLPAKDKAAGVTVTGGKTQVDINGYTGEPVYQYSTVTLWFNGKVSGYRQLGFVGVNFRPCKTGAVDDAGSFDITVGLNTGERDSSLEFIFTPEDDDPVPLVADGCSIGKITGVKAVAGKNNATRVDLDHTLLTMTTGFAGAPDVELKNHTAVLTHGKNEIGALIFRSDTSFTSYGDLQIARIDLTNAYSGFWLAGRQDKNGNSTIRVSGEIRRSVDDDEEEVFLPVKLIKSTEKGTGRKAGDDIGADLIAADTYAGKPLLYAPVADAAPVRAFPFLDDDEIISYKTPAMYVANGNPDAMEVFIKAYDENDDEALETYAMSFYEAMQIIDNTGRTDYEYWVRLLKIGADDVTFTGKPGNEGKGTFGAMNLPSKAASVRIYSDSAQIDDIFATLQFSGAVTAKCPVELYNIKLQSGKMQSRKDDNDQTVTVFVPDANGVTLDTGAAVAGNACKIGLSKVFNETDPDAGQQLRVSGIKGSSGIEIGVSEHVLATGAVTVAALRMEWGSVLTCQADLTVKGVTEVAGGLIEGRDPAKKITLGDLAWVWNYAGDDSTLKVRYPLTKAVYTVSGGNRKLSKPPVSNLKITGEIGQKVKLRLEPQIWQEENALMHTEAGYYLLANRDKTPNADGYNQDMVAMNAGDLVAAKRLAEMTKASVTSVQVMLGDTVYKLATDPSGTAQINGAVAATTSAGKLRLLKQGGNLFLTTVSPVVRMTATGGYDGIFCSLDEAVAEAKKIAKKENNVPVTEVTFTLLGNIGCEDPETDDNHDDEITSLNIATPVAKLTFPAGVKKLTLKSERDDAPYGIAFTGNSLTLASDTVLEDVELYCVKKAGASYTWIPYSVNIGTYTLTEYGSAYSYCGDPDDDSDSDHDGRWIGKITGTGTLRVENRLEAQSISVKNLHVAGTGTVSAYAENGGDLTVSGVTTLDTRDSNNWSDVRAGGKLTLNDVVLTAREPRGDLVAGYSQAVEKNGKITSPAAYRITINGTVRCSHPEFAGVPDEESAPLRIGGGIVDDGTVLATAPKVPDGWFRPWNAVTTGDNIFVYKSGKNIITDEGKRAEAEAALYSTESFVDADGAYVKTDGTELTGDRLRMKSDFLTVTEALKEVDSRAATARLADGISALNKGVKLPYEDQEVMLLSDARIENAQRTALAALTLPARVQTLTLSSGVDADADDVPDRVALRFTGGVTLKSNTVLTDAVDPVSMKSVTENKQQVWHPTPAAYALGAYTLTVRGVTGDGHTFGEHDYLDGICAQGSWSTIGNVTATAGKGRLVLENSVSRTDPAKRLVVTVSGNLNSDVSLQANTQLIAQGSAAINMLEFGEANRTLQHDWNPGAGIGGGSYGDPHEISCDESPVFTLAGSKALTLGVVLQHGESKFENPRDDNNHYWISTEAVPGILQKRDPSAPMVFKGSKEHENSRFVHDGDTADSATEIWVGPETVATVPADLCIFTGAGSVTDNPERLILRAGDGGNRYNWYTYKDGLYAGNLRPGQP